MTNPKPKATLAAGLIHVMGSQASFIRLVAVTIAIFVTFSVLNPAVYLSAQNFQFVSLATPELAILSLAISVTMLTAGIDLSVVGTANVTAVVCALVLTKGDGSIGSTLLGCVAGLAAALLCGAVNGLLISKINVPPILATLGTSQLFLGIALVLSNGTVIKGLPATFTGIALMTVAGIPMIFLIMLVLAVIVWIMISRTALGFRMRMVGANSTAADFSGIRRSRILTQTYMLSAGLAGVAGLIISSRASGANSQYGASYILLAIVVAVLAGVDPDGGYLTVPGVLIAAFTLQLLSSGLLSLNISSHIVNIAQGLLLILMVVLNGWGSSWWQQIRKPLARTQVPEAVSEIPPARYPSK